MARSLTGNVLFVLFGVLMQYLGVCNKKSKVSSHTSVLTTRGYIVYKAWPTVLSQCWLPQTFSLISELMIK